MTCCSCTIATQGYNNITTANVVVLYCDNSQSGCRGCGCPLENYYVATGNAKLATMEEESGDSEEILEVVSSITSHIGYLWKAIMNYQ